MPQPHVLAQLSGPCTTSSIAIPARPTWRQSTLVASFLCTFLLPVFLCGQAKINEKKTSATKAIASSASTMGQWAPPANFCTYPCLVGGEAALLNNGQVLFYYYPGNLAQHSGSQAVLLDPITNVVTNVSMTTPGNIFCSGLTILPTGDVLTTGGNVQGTCPAGGCGVTTAMLFNPVTSTWTTATPMTYPRWYPSSVELPSSTLLELSGSDQTGKVVQPYLESYNYEANTWTTLPSTANLPSDVLQPYPRMSLLPSGNVFMSAPSPHTYTFNPTTNLWSSVGYLNYGYRYYAPHALLPGLEQVIVAGGSSSHMNGGGAATNTVEMINMSVTNPQWTYIAPMNYARMNENLVLLPDGTVLAVGGGGGNGAYANPVLAAEVYNPKTGTWTVLASQTIQRTYHSTAVLLPDGRVVSAGSDNGQSTEVTYEIYSPPYLFNGPRPIIKSSPTTLAYGAQFNISYSSASAITRVALIRPGATTHADDFDQRYVDLTFTVGTGMIKATAPANGNSAPPGYYMLVIVNSNGIPSVMPFLYLG